MVIDSFQKFFPLSIYKFDFLVHGSGTDWSFPHLPHLQVVAVMAEGKQHALAIGLMRMSTEEIRSVNKVIIFSCLFYFNQQQSIHYAQMSPHIASTSA